MDCDTERKTLEQAKVILTKHLEIPALTNREKLLNEAIKTVLESIEKRYKPMTITEIGR